MVVEWVAGSLGLCCGRELWGPGLAARGGKGSAMEPSTADELVQVHGDD